MKRSMPKQRWQHYLTYTATRSHWQFQLSKISQQTVRYMKTDITYGTPSVFLSSGEHVVKETYCVGAWSGASLNPWGDILTHYCTPLYTGWAELYWWDQQNILYPYMLTWRWKLNQFTKHSGFNDLRQWTMNKIKILINSGDWQSPE
jgi:hypothetical protein